MVGHAQLLESVQQALAGAEKVIEILVALRDITLESLRRNISVVLQDTFLFNGTIEENIAFAKPDARFEEIELSASVARIHDDIMQMPEAYQTQVVERGVKLSGGQKQRIAIARAVLCQVPVLILDEATASVDVHTEAKIQQAINEIAGSRTIVTIAHRLSTVRNADLILVFEKGRIVQSGSHDELIEKDGLYRRLCLVREDAVWPMCDTMVRAVYCFLTLIKLPYA